MSYHTSSLATRAFERILLVKPSSLGDVLHGLPVLCGLRRRYPDARIDWLVAPPFAPLIENHPDITDVVPFDRKRFGRVARDWSATRAFVEFLRDLRRRRYELVIDLQGLFRSGLITRATGAAVRIGFADAREGARWFYTELMATDDPHMHAVDRNFLVSELLGFEDGPLRFGLTISREARAGVERLLGEAGWRAGPSMIVVAPGARWETKVWPRERFAETIDQLCSNGSSRAVLVGSSEDVDRCDWIREHSSAAPLSLAGRTSVSELVALIDRADLVICQDSAPMHIAAALDRPLVCLIGPTNPRRTGPYLRGGDVVRLPLECSPCYLRRLSQCPHAHRCMVDLNVGLVVEAANKSVVSPV